MRQHGWWILTLLTVVLAGCAEVKTDADFDAVEQMVAEATDQPEVYRPGADDALAAKVAALRRDGISLDEAVAIALLNNPRFQSAAMNVGMARADLVQSGLLSNPVLGVGVRLPSEGGLVNIEGGLAQEIADLWQIPVRERAAEATLDTAILNLAREAARLAADTKTAYYTTVAAAERRRVAERNAELVRQAADAAVERRDAGAATQLDVNLAQSQSLDAELATVSARLEAANARRQLAILLGLTDVAGEFELIDSLPDAPPTLTDADALVRLALTQRLDVRASARAIMQFAEAHELELRKVFPSVQLGVSFEREERRRQGGRDLLADTVSASVANGSLTAPTIEPRPGAGQTFIIGPSLNIELPIFDQNQAQIAKAAFALKQALKNQEAIERALVQEVRTAVDQAQTAWRLVAVYRDESLPLAEENLTLSRDGYRAGKTSFLTVLEAQRFYLQSRMRLIESQQAAAATLPALEVATSLPLRRLLAAESSESQLEANHTLPDAGAPRFAEED